MSEEDQCARDIVKELCAILGHDFAFRLTRACLVQMLADCFGVLDAKYHPELGLRFRKVLDSLIEIIAWVATTKLGEKQEWTEKRN